MIYDKISITYKQRIINMSSIFIASDHGGVELKTKVYEYLMANNYEVVDHGCYSTDTANYPDFAKKVVNSMVRPDDKGILFCGTGIGMSIVANRYDHIRAALCHTLEEAKLCREHNDANVLCLGGRIIDPKLALSIVTNFLNTDFSNEQRHIDRIRKINER